MNKLVVVPLMLGLVSGCNSNNDLIPPAPEPTPTPTPAPTPTLKTVTIETDFGHDDSQGWDSGFSDFPPGNEPRLELINEVRNAPGNGKDFAFLLASNNGSDDIFMYLKRQVNGLVPGAEYELTGEISIISNAGIGCFGAGGSPGEAVYMKVGASEIEPTQVDYYMNVDIGDQSLSGNDAIIFGNAGVEGPPCIPADVITYGIKTLEFSGETAFKFTASDDGDIWLLLGSDSGYEGYTEIYYTDIKMTLTPSE